MNRFKKWHCVLVIFSFIILPQSFASEEVESDDIQASKWKDIHMPFNYQNLQVPRELWENIKEILRKSGVSDAIVEDFSVLPISMQMSVASEDMMVLKDKTNYRLNFIEGGGKVDLFNYVIGKGTFHMRMSPQFPELSDFHMLYISDSPGKTVGTENWGNGCGKIFNLTAKSDTFTGEEGIRVTSSRRHYMHLMAGTYVFFQLVEDRLYLGYILLEDSRYPNFKCSKEA